MHYNIWYTSRNSRRSFWASIIIIIAVVVVMLYEECKYTCQPYYTLCKTKTCLPFVIIYIIYNSTAELLTIIV